jgi:hypothetical protein
MPAKARNQGIAVRCGSSTRVRLLDETGGSKRNTHQFEWASSESYDTRDVHQESADQARKGQEQSLFNMNTVLRVCKLLAIFTVLNIKQ